MAYAHEQLSSRSKEENTAYWYFPEKMKAKVKRNYPIAFEGYDTAYYPDFVLLDEQIIIEIDGGYHNGQNKLAVMREKTKCSVITILQLSASRMRIPVSTFRFGKGS